MIVGVSMKKRAVMSVVAALMLIAPVLIFADTGIGGVAGYEQPSGLSLKIDNFPVVSLGWSVTGNWLDGTVDYWFINDKLDRNFLWYLGMGSRIYVGDDFGLGLRVPIGIQWYFMPRFELFGELVPGFDILPSSGFDMSAGIGLRFHI